MPAQIPVRHTRHQADAPATAHRAHPAPPAARAASGTGHHRPATVYEYKRYSELAGPLTEAGAGRPYRVRTRSLLAQEPHRYRAALLLCAAPVCSALLLLWLLRPDHWVRREHVALWETAADLTMLVSIALIESFRLFTVVSNAHATLVARDPVPVVPQPGTKVAFLTSFVPGKEPLAMVRATLEGAVRIRHTGPLDVWLLDEGDDPEVKELCARLGVRHFSRKGIAKWNQPKGSFRAKTKHGNYNAWLDAHGDDYEFMACVDTDHVPLPNFLERMLGYFRDPDVAFVVGPQVYGNYDTAVTKAAESQQFLFHALIQRAGNAYGGPMFVGTNNAVRISALRSIGGLYDSITEDMATGFELHRHRNPVTRKKWRSVYTPDVLAVGEGPSTWTDFFTQQMRWSRGTYEALLKQFWKGPFTLSPGKLLNYTLMITYYPMTALNWVLSALSCALFLMLGASGVHIPAEIWMMLYSDAATLQIGLYIWNRRHNVSPHEPEGSGGLAGMLLSALSAPIYAKSLCDAVLRRTSRFVVTPKGDSSSPDRLSTFRIHLLWAGVFGSSLIGSFFFGHEHAAMRTWASLALALSLAPVAIWYGGVLRRGRGRPAAPAVPTARSDSPCAPAKVSIVKNRPQDTALDTPQDTGPDTAAEDKEEAVCAL
ncbi:glycosyltransferase [Streptomyces sp. NA02950]|uniref:glycosyltransferase family 2 protein n=1 Tax=Streptomyces sp. NA02950 TaxID=2742137 RepID=UPI0015916824|nr:cellulose synthase catalytic subunit [Streptomyces sp. NA02950]QKV95832.1 glycosyltransferase [Streptomyces sp. NA02950]